MTFVFRSWTYLFGALGPLAILGLVFYSFTNPRPFDLAITSFVCVAGVLAAMAVVFAVGRGQVRVRVGDENIEVSRLLRPTLRIPRAGTTGTVEFVDDRQLNPGPVLVEDRAKSEAVRRWILGVRNVLSDGGPHAATGSAMADFAVVRFMPANGKPATVLLPGPRTLDDLGELVDALGLEAETRATEDPGSSNPDA